MGLLSSFNIGVTGLDATGGGMSVIADNIANAHTTGFKTSRAEFQDVLAKSLKGIDGGDQIGSGTKLAHVKPIFNQGTVVRTDQMTDLALNGNGFFTIEAPFGRGFTRDGSFHFDKEGKLINGDGFFVQGFQLDDNGNIGNRVGPIQLGRTTIPAQGTENVTIQMNLDSREDIMEFNPDMPEITSNYNTSVVIYDTVGTARLVTVYFVKDEPNSWSYHVMGKGEDIEGGEPDTEMELASGQIIFNEKGILAEEVENGNNFNFNKGSSPEQKVKFNFGESVAEGGSGLFASTQFGSVSAVEKHYQDGATAATLGSLSFDDRGVLTAVYNNGETRDLGQVAITKFENNEGLFKVGKNLFKETRKSGPAAVGRPLQAGRGEILSKSREESNVDIASEFVALMKAQKNFTANTRTITTADSMLQEILNIKR